MNARIVSVAIRAMAVVLFAFGFGGCHSHGSSASGQGSLPAVPGEVTPPSPATASLIVQVSDVANAPISGATVTFGVDGDQQQVTTAATGRASLGTFPVGLLNFSVSADGFETVSVDVSLSRGPQTWYVTLDGTDAWAKGAAVVLGTQMLERGSDGGSLTFAVDVAVIAGAEPEALETLTDVDFGIFTYDCGWGGPRDCASDAEGNETGFFSTDGQAHGFGLQPPSVRRPYLVGVLAERSGDGTEWDLKGPELKSFATAVGGNDVVSLASVQTEGDATTLTVYGPFTSDGSTFSEAIDRFGLPAGEPVAIHASLLESIRWTAAAAENEFPDRELTLLVLSSAGLSVAETAEAVALARQSGVRVSNVGWNYGLPETAVRTGGFLFTPNDPRQFGMVFGILDQVLAGTVPYYRMQFQLTGSRNTFVPGGNVKLGMHVSVPSPVAHRGVYTELNIAIP